MTTTVLETASCSNLEELADTIDHFMKLATAYRHAGMAVATQSEVSLAMIRDDRTKLITIKIVSAA